MNSRERVLTSLAHKQPDKVPFDIGGTGVSSIHVKCVKDLKAWYGLDDDPVTCWSIFLMTGEMPAELIDIMGIDMVNVKGKGTNFGLSKEKMKPWTTPWGQVIMAPYNMELSDDGKGGLFIYPGGDKSVAPSGHMPQGSKYFDNIERPSVYDEDDPDPADNLEEFSVMSDADVAFFAGRAKEAAATGKAVAFIAPASGLADAGQTPGSGLKNPKGIRTVADWYMAPLMYPEFVKAQFEGQTDIMIENLKKINAACGEYLDVVVTCSADLAYQNGQFFSPETYYEFYHPNYKRAHDWIHANTNWKTFKHCCGAAVPLIPGFIDSGFDILNPVQCSADGMDPAWLKKEFGKDICFWGGGVDTQYTLPRGTPEEVRKEVLQRCEIFAKDGGFVFGAIHSIQYDVPAENIVAMADALREFNGG